MGLVIKTMHVFWSYFLMHNIVWPNQQWLFYCAFSVPLKLCLWSLHGFLCAPAVNSPQPHNYLTLAFEVCSLLLHARCQSSEKNKQTSASMLEKVKTGSKGVTELSPESLIFSKLLQCLSVYIICVFLHWYITKMAVETNTIVKSCLQHGHANRTTMAKRLLLFLLSFTKAITASMNKLFIYFFSDMTYGLFPTVQKE